VEAPQFLKDLTKGSPVAQPNPYKNCVNDQHHGEASDLLLNCSLNANTWSNDFNGAPKGSLSNLVNGASELIANRRRFRTAAINCWVVQKRYVVGNSTGITDILMGIFTCRAP
jgi:hypothetical protein